MTILQGSADIGFVPSKMNPPCHLESILTNVGQGSARNIEITNGVANLNSSMSQQEFLTLDVSKALEDIRSQRAKNDEVRRTYRKQLEANVAELQGPERTAEIVSNEADIKRMDASIAPRRVVMELTHGGTMLFEANLCGDNITDATVAPFVDVLLYSFEDDFGSHNGETCISYFPGKIIVPCTVPVPLPPEGKEKE